MHATLFTHQYSDHGPVMSEWVSETAVFFHFQVWAAVVIALRGTKMRTTWLHKEKNKNPDSTHLGPDTVSSRIILEAFVALNVDWLSSTSGLHNE